LSTVKPIRAQPARSSLDQHSTPCKTRSRISRACWRVLRKRSMRAPKSTGARSARRRESLCTARTHNSTGTRSGPARRRVGPLLFACDKRHASRPCTTPNCSPHATLKTRCGASVPNPHPATIAATGRTVRPQERRARRLGSTHTARRSSAGGSRRDC
jgi:hypothetical protein